MNKESIFIELVKKGDYSVSSEGVVVNNKTKNLIGTGTSRDYPTISFLYEGKIRRVLVHRIVYKLYIGDIPDNLQVNHNDGDKKNNKVENLELVTASENMKHAFEIGLNPKLFGESNANASLTMDQVRKIRELYKKGMSRNKLSKMFKVSRPVISDVIHNKRYIE